MGRKKQFIDKKNSTTYRLVHRSLQDPLAADNDADQQVLVELGGNYSKGSWDCRSLNGVCSSAPSE